MKVAHKVAKRLVKKSPQARCTLTISNTAYEKIDELRGHAARSAYIEALIEQEFRRIENERFAQKVNAEYANEELRRETLRINAQFPIHGE